ncbi:hypothetical protein [Acinetobacter colistiniresistens]|uniref:hypothetical protein n=1 Tax=Acinetobacter colistiniresistens TaxID=280145 RepID=UPI00125026DC|nr:hypothetical protein [Acinetobacter colistiniresistens]
MNNKCINTGNWVEMCDSLKKCIEENIGDLSTQVRTRFSDGANRLAITAGRFKKNKVGLAYCPACGEKIETEFKEQSQ